MKRIISTCLISSFLLALTGCAKSASYSEPTIEGEAISVIEESFLDGFEDTVQEYQLYDLSDLSADILENRNGNVIVERCVGVVTDASTGDGRLLNYRDEGYDFISYSRVDGIYDGAVVVSYMVYETSNNYIDDIAERYDFIL